LHLRLKSIAVSVAMVAACAAQNPPKTTMHRIQAGQLGADGWTLARSTEGGFAVKLPVKFNDFTMINRNLSEAVAYSFTLTGKNEAGIKFTATRTTFRKASDAEDQFRRLQQGGLSQDPPTAVKAGTFQGFPSLEATYVKQKAFNLEPVVLAFQRNVLVGANLVTLVVETPYALREVAKQSVPTFLDSLDLGLK
jgi:hypothetical protein